MALRISDAARTAALPFNLPVPPREWDQRPAGISLCMIVRNEERFLADALESVRGVVDEINIVDTGSTDATLEIAARFSANIEQRTWCDDFSWARNEALAMATRRWILVLDADERLAPQTAQELRALRTVPAHLCGLWVRCRNLVDDFKGTGAMTNALLRVFPNHPRIRYRNPVHEFACLDGSQHGMDAVPTALEIDHRGYLSDVVAARNKAARNFDISRRALETAQDDPYQWFNFASSAVLAEAFDEAIEALERVRRMLAGQTRGFKPGALALLADLYCEQRGDYQRAVAIAHEALVATPHLANAHFTVGKALARLGRYKEARDAFAAAVADGEYAGENFVVDDEISAWKAHSEIGVTFVAEGRYAEALTWFELGLKNRPEAQPLRLNRARALEQLGRLAEAEEAFRWARDHYRDDLSSVDLVNFLLRRGRSGEALSRIDEAMQVVSPRTATLMLGSGVCVALRAGDEPAARRYLGRAQEAAALSGAGEVSLAELFVHLGEHRAIALLDQHSWARRAVQLPTTSGLALAQGLLGGTPHTG
ncbi:MAG TPA: glycosyltransferase [Candidatus Binatia bacterium]|nr:glycosyltransferase [Candidatus Binatia bacterium]